LGFLHSFDAPVPTLWTKLPLRAPVLVGWAGGPRADSLAGKGLGFLTERALYSVAVAFGISRAQVESQLEAVYTHDWQSDAFTRGAYAYLPVGGLEAQRTLASPVEGTLYFAGEATNDAGHIGTVHGAFASGERAAREIIEDARSV
jgi:monoamine oxidase